jgi:Rrf2 family protein
MLSKSGIHAVRALIVLAELPENTYAGAVSIAEKIGAPKNYLGKILQQLTHSGVVSSQKGLGGGFQLARNPKDIALLDIVDPIEHINRWSGCILGRDQCSDTNPCPIHDHWKSVKDAYLRLLTETTIADLVNRDKAFEW